MNALLLLALTQLDPSIENIYTQPTWMQASPLFQFAPANGAGMGAACAGTTPTGSKGETLTGFARGSSATCIKTVGAAPQLIANGDLVTLSTNQPRVMAGIDDTSILGMLDEGAGTNVCLRSQQHDNAAWSGANSGVALPIVTADQAVAPDGTTTADRVQIPATTVAGGQYSFWYQSTATTDPGSGSLFVRGNGTSGTLDLALYGSGGWHAADCTYVSTGWTLCLNENVAGVAAVGFGNFSGLAFVGSGNRTAQDVFVWGSQQELGAHASSYIATTSAAVTRSAETPPYATTRSPISGVASIAASFIAPVAGHAYGDGILGLSSSPTPADPGIAIEYNATGITSAPYSPVVPTSMGCFRQVGDLVGYTQDTLGLGGTQPNIGRIWCATSGPEISAHAFFGKMTGFYTTATRGFSLASSNIIVLGGWSTAAPPLNGIIKLVCADPTQCIGGARGTIKVAWVGDSIVYGYPNPSTSPAVQLNQLLGPQEKAVDLGINGSTTPDCAARWTSDVKGYGFVTLIWSCGVNDVATGNTGTFTAATVETVLSAAIADGEKVIVTGIAPWKGSSQWSLGKNTEGLTYNSLISAWARTHGVTYIDTSSLGGQGGDPDVLLNVNNPGDNVHLTVAGQHTFAQLVQAGSP